VLGAGAELAGAVTVVDLGLDVSRARAHVVEHADVATWLPGRAVDSHKWKAACWIIAGSESMTGAAELTASAAARAGSGYVRLSVPGLRGVGPIETVEHPLPQKGWGGSLEGIERFGSLVIGPGLGRSPWAAACVREVVSACPIPVVIDGDGLNAIAGRLDELAGCAQLPVLTPHDGEFETLTGARPGADRIAAARSLAAESTAVVLLKGPTTIVAEPGGEVLVSTSGDARLATAGSGDVLSGVIGAFIARGLDPFRAAAAGAWVHGRAADLASPHGMVASDLLLTLPEVLDATHLG
jgi:NAD(P)H-hydrate epimerase